MEKMGVLRTIYRAACFRSSLFSAISHNQLRHLMAYRSLFTVSSPSVSTTTKRIPCDFSSPFAISVGSARSFSEDGQEILKNVFRAAEAVEEFGGKIMTLKMEVDDSIGMSGEDVKPLPELPEKHGNAIRIFYQR